MTRRATSSIRGFTLLEVAIVIVVIGLIAGGILLGRDLIKAGRIRMQIAQIDEINAAVNTFKLKYSCLPGDCRTATQFFGAAAQPEAVRNGNGDGYIRGFAGTGWTYQWAASAIWPAFNGNNGAGQWAEWSYVFDHLSAAGLFAMNQYDETNAANSNVPGVGYPLMRLQGEGNGPIHSANWNNGPSGVVVGFEPEGPGADAVSRIPAGHKIRLGAGKCYPGNWGTQNMCFQAGLSAEEARAIDQKIDDGLPLTGKTVITTPVYIYNGPDYQYCATFASNTYRSTVAVWGGEPITRYCALDISASF